MPRPQQYFALTLIIILVILFFLLLLANLTAVMKTLTPNASLTNGLRTSSFIALVLGVITLLALCIRILANRIGVARPYNPPPWPMQVLVDLDDDIYRPVFQPENAEGEGGAGNRSNVGEDGSARTGSVTGAGSEAGAVPKPEVATKVGEGSKARGGSNVRGSKRVSTAWRTALRSEVRAYR